MLKYLNTFFAYVEYYCVVFTKKVRLMRFLFTQAPTATQPPLIFLIINYQFLPPNDLLNAWWWAHQTCCFIQAQTAVICNLEAEVSGG